MFYLLMLYYIEYLKQSKRSLTIEKETDRQTHYGSVGVVLQALRPCVEGKTRRGKPVGLPFPFGGTSQGTIGGLHVKVLTLWAQRGWGGWSS